MRIICTCKTGAVAIIIPSPRMIRVLAEGGGLVFGSVAQWVHGRVALHDWLRDQVSPWALREIYATNLLPLDLARAWEIEKLVRDPTWRPDRQDRKSFAATWVDGIIHGGYAEREALMLIAEYSKPAWSTALELVNADALPKDRTHRDAWRRSANGGPIWIDETAAQRIDEARMWERYDVKAA